MPWQRLAKWTISCGLLLSSWVPRAGFAAPPTKNSKAASKKSDANTTPPSAPQAKKPASARKVQTKTPPPKKYYAALGLARTLPEDIMRVRLPFRVAEGYTGYDENGDTEDLGLELHAVATALVVEYGLTSDLSLQFVAPYVIKNQLAMDADIFEESETYQTEYQNFVNAMAALLEANGMCASQTECAALIQDGFALPSDTSVTLPTGEAVTLKGGVPLRNYADSLVKNAAKPADGATGLGDIEIGALYNLFRSDTQMFSIGGGLRLPTGKFTDVPSAQRPTGAGITSLGLRLNYDYQLIDGMVLSLQNQSEVMVAKGKRQKSSLVDPNELNEGDPTSAEAVASGSNGKGNEQEVETKGVRNVGIVKIEWGLTDVAAFLQPVGIGVSYKYDLKPEVLVGGAVDAPASQLQTAAFAVKWDGLGMEPRLPFNVEYEYETPLSGKNIALAADSHYYKFNLYYLF